MLSARKWYLIAVAGIVVSAGLVVACREDRPTQPEAVAAGATPTKSAPAPSYTPGELRDLNPYAWGGRLHNAVVTILREERGKSGSRADRCERIVARVAALDVGAPAMSNSEIRQGLQRFCGPIAKTVASIPAAFEDTTWVYPSATAEAMLYDIVDETEAATSANDLASRLSPYYNASQSMGFPDSEAIPAIISVAQDSYDYWSPDATYEMYEDEAVAYYNSCAGGEAEGGYWEDEEGTFLCTQGQWNQVWYKGSEGRPVFQYAAFFTPSSAQSYWCYVPTSGRRAAVRRGDVFSAVVGAIGSFHIWFTLGSNPGTASVGILFLAAAGASELSKYLMAKQVAAC
jgi:hypothetical protein